MADGIGFLMLIKGVVTDQLGVDIEMRKKLPGASGIFGGDIIHLGKHPQRPLGNIFQVADWC